MELQRIDSVVECQGAEVFNFHCSPVEAYIADGFVVHNCSYGHGTIASGMHTDMDKRDMIPREKMLEVLDDFRDMGVQAVTFSGGGEPLSHPDIVEFMDRVNRYQISLSIITNGSLLERQRAEVLAEAAWVRVSIDYTNAEQLAESRRIPHREFARIMSNMESFAKIKDSTCDLGVNYIVTRENYRGLAEFAERLKDIGVDNLRVSPVWRPDFAEYHEPIKWEVLAEIDRARAISDDRFSVYSSYDLAAPAHSTERGFHRCFVMETVPVIGADQQVFRCHNTAYSEHGLIGSIKDRRFKDLWFSEETAANFRAFDAATSCRHQCAAHSKIVFTQELLDASGDAFV